MTEDTQQLAIRVLIALAVLTWGLALWRAHRDPKFENFSIPGFVMTKEGFPNSVALMEIGSWVVYSVILIALTMKGALTETYVLIYVAFPSVRAAYGGYLRAQNPLPLSTTTTQSTETITTTVPAEKPAA